MDIKDLNDNSPVFERQSYTMAVTENTTVGATVGLVKATDQDIGNNGLVIYKFMQADIGMMLHIVVTQNAILMHLLFMWRQQWRLPPPPNNFRLAKCDTRFRSSSSQEAIKNSVQVSVLA